MQQKSLRMPLVVTGIGLQEQAEHNVSETESTTNFTEKHGEQFISLFWHFGIQLSMGAKRPGCEQTPNHTSL